jgi:tetratricopeptide (TPR) repeat protein
MAAAVLLALAGCSRMPVRAVQRIDVLPFENLTGDASFDWIRNAGPAILTEEVVGAAHLFPLRVPTISEATLAGATRLLHCGFSKRAGSNAGGPNDARALHFEFAIEDAERHQMVETGAADGDVLFAMTTLARRQDPGARPFSSPHQEAAVAWGRGEFERAVTLDADFGTAWAGWVEQLARSGKPDQALVVAERALARASLRSPWSKTQIQLQAAVLRKDEPARIAALTALAGLAPNDTGTVMALAEIEQRQRHYSASAALYRRVVAIEPANADALNALGYTEGEAGNLDAARKALEEYGRQPDQAPNALDSLGEVYFMNGRFAEAEKSFSQLTKQDPTFLGGAPLMKSAYARWLAVNGPGGNVQAADAIMRRFLDSRAAQKDPAVIWREATWLYATGRQREALAKLESAPADQKATIERQRSVWRGEVKLPQDLLQLKALYESTNPALDGLARTIYAAALARAGKTEEARALLKRWPLPDSAGDPLLQSLVYPQFLELRRKLGIQ